MPFTIIWKSVRENNIEETQTTRIDGSRIRIGRGTENEIRLDDPSVSLNHAVIEKGEETYLLKDLGSAKGISVNHRQAQSCQLADNDRIQIGPYTLFITLPSPGDPVTIVVERTQAGILPGRGEIVEYVSKYKLSTSLFKKTTLTVLGAVLLLAGTVTAIVMGERTAFAPGEVSESHSLFENDCSRCHAVAWQGVSDKSCTTCHAGPRHQENQWVTPACTECHMEHRGRIVLASVRDQHCIQCHSNLKTKDGSPSRFESRILSFHKGHPEFAVSVRTQNGAEAVRVRISDPQNLIDMAQLKLNHKVHLDPELRGPEGYEQLDCTRCHEMDGAGAYMLPIRYEKHCSKCHRLEFDERFPERVVPHDELGVIHSYLITTYSQSVFEYPEDFRAGTDGSQRRLPRRPFTPEEEKSNWRWVAQQVRKTEQLLFKRKVCSECHVLEGSSPETPFRKVAETSIPQRWLPLSVFDHQAHANLRLACTACHREAAVSEETRDVLLPGIQSCRECHYDGGASSKCVKCHVYHDKTVPIKLDGPHTIPEVLAGSSQAAPPPLAGY